MNSISESRSNQSSDMEIQPSQMHYQTETSEHEGEGDEMDFFAHICEKSLYFNPQYSSVKHMQH